MARRLVRLRSLAPLAIVAAALTLGACRSNQPLEVSVVQLGRALASDNSISSHTTVFKPDDTIYVSVLTTAMGRGTLSVRWMFGSQVIDEPKKDVAYKGAAATEFHLRHPGGFPPGSYSVEAFLDGVSVGRRTFTVER
jgi:hypothetical protein